MPKITILGSGITGLSVAAMLPRGYEVTIVARDMPGDPPSLEWASPWAGALWMPTVKSTPAEQKMQLEAFSYLWKMAVSDPEAGVRRIEVNEILDYLPAPGERYWYHGLMPEFRELGRDDLPEGSSFGMSYKSIVLNPQVMLPYLKSKLAASGVEFRRVTVQSLSDLKGLGHDILINASGLGARRLEDVRDLELHEVRGQITIVRSTYDKVYLRHGKDYISNYTYVIPRLDGTVVLGGNRQYGVTSLKTDQEFKKNVLQRVHLNLPNHFPTNYEDFDVVEDIVGFHPQRECGVRVEMEELGAQKVIQAYGILGGGYILSFGLAKRVVELVFESEFAQVTSLGQAAINIVEKTGRNPLDMVLSQGKL